MNLLNSILTLIKRSLFLIVFISMLFQTIVLTVSVISENETELIVEVDWEEDTDEENKDASDEKINHEIVNSHNTLFSFTEVIICYEILNPIWDYSSEIPIPPPRYS